MRRFFKGVLFICLATLMAACDNDTLQQEQKGDKIQISLSFNIGNSPLSIGGPMAGTKGVGEGLFDAIYEGIVSGEIVAAYELTFTNKSTGASTIFNGRWNDGKTISLEKGEYIITGACTASGNGIYNQCSLTMQDEATVTEQTTSIKIKAQYDCSLLILNDETVEKVVYYASQNDSACFAKYKTLTYAFLKSSADFTQGGVAFLKVYFKNGYSSIVNLGQINIKKGNYYLLENLYNYADAGLVLDIDKMENGDDNNTTKSIAFFPTSYADKTIASWYAYTDKEQNKTKTEAVFLFTDQTFVVTKNKVYSTEDGRSPERDIQVVGTYQIIEGDYGNGRAVAAITDGSTITIVIKDGKLTTGQGDVVFIKQDNAKLPNATDPTNGGGNNQGGDNNNLDPFFPKSYEDKNISAWYSYSATEAAQGYEFKRTAAVYLFEDNTYVATINMSTSNPQYGQHCSCMIVSEGTYQKVEGNFTTGKITITDDKNSTTVEIQDGQLKIKDTETPEVTIYFKQDNSNVPQPSEPTENGSQSGGEYEHPIEFSITSGKITKASMSSNSDVANNGGFKVWGFKNVSTSSDWKTVFDDITVSSSDYGSTWTYSPLMYWDDNAQYKFYAAAPAQNANGTITFADNTICVNNVHSAKKSDSDVECKVQRGVYSAWGSSPRTVEFTLSHIMANLVVKIKISDALSGYTVKLNSLQIEGWNGGNGNFKLNPERYSNADNAEWTIPVYSNGKLNMVDENGVLLSVDGKVIGDYLLIPQSIDDNCTFKMTYTIISGGYSENYNYSLKMNQLYQALYTGCRYIATFTINPDVITFDAACLTDWEDGNNTIEIW